MKTLLITVGIVSLFISQLALADDQGFRLTKPEVQQCKNAQNVIGKNPDFVGECGAIISQNLNERDFSGGNLKGAYFIESQVRKAQFLNADLTGSIIKATNFSEALFVGAKLLYLRIEVNSGVSTFTQANFENANLSFSKYAGTPSEHPDFQRTNFKKAKLDDVQLVGNFSFADMTRATGLRAKIYGKFVAANFTNADFRFAQMGHSEMRSANFFDADFSGAAVPYADFSGAFFVGSNFSGANLTDSKFLGARLYGADFSQANLMKAVLSSAHIRGADFRRALLCGADLRQLDIQFGILLNDAQYNSQTLLPFTDEAAARLGMRKVQTCQ